MSDAVFLRPAQSGEEEILSELCLRSKALWGYDAAFIAACAPFLKVTTHAVDMGWATVAHEPDGRLLGVCQIDPEGHGGSLDLMFITPEAIGKGVGRRLFGHAKEQLKQLGHTKMTILSDPNAETAYIHMGAKRVEMRPSDVFKGRKLPWLEVAL
jgi:GNAT superfamily N-acetyltransferase